MSTVAPIAIVGMSGRFPTAPSIPALWELLVEGRNAVTDAPTDRPWFRDLYDENPQTPGKVPSLRGGFLTGLDAFDAAFFDMPAREARRTDPQLRLLLETGYEAFQDAGISLPSAGKMTTGTFVGACFNDYFLRQLFDLDDLDFYAEIGGARSSFSGRLAYNFHLRGPAMTVDTACSSSLTAIHYACMSLRTGDCDMALAGGSNLFLAPYTTITFNQAGALSPDGRCKFGDAKANGYVRGEAVAVVILKTLAKALADGDRIRAVILGSAVNNDGFTGNGMAAPSVEGQMEMLRTAYGYAGVDPREVSFIEAHGTGTRLGDKAELTALSEVLGPRGRDRERCYAGSAKALLGHTEGAAGIVGLVKAVLCLEHNMVTGNPQLETPNPAIDWAHSAMQLSVDNVELPDTGKPLLAGVNSFGATGTNAHLVLGQGPRTHGRRKPKDASADSYILVLSARNADALHGLAERYLQLLELPDGKRPQLDLLCAAAAQRRDHHECRLAITADTPAEMADALRDFLAGEERHGMASMPDGAWGKPKVIFVFPGQGSQWEGMGRELLRSSRPFRDSLVKCDAVLREHAGWSLIGALERGDRTWLAETAKVQPALWAMSVALSDMWRAWDIHPDAVLGQSQGEIAAAYCAGALSLVESGRLSCLRAKLINELAPPGAVCWVERPHAEIPALLAEIGTDAAVAVAESPTSCVLSGSAKQIDAVLSGCEERGISCQRVQVAYAAHSPQIDPVRQPMLEGLADLHPRAGEVPFLSTVTGGEVAGADLNADYWWRNLRETVLLDDVIRAQQSSETVVFLQVSPHPLLTVAIQQSAALAGGDSHVLPTLRRNRPELATVYGSLAVLYARGCEPKWSQIHGGIAEFVELPTYPWQRSSFWHQASNFPWPPIGAASAEYLSNNGASATAAAPAVSAPAVTETIPAEPAVHEPAQAAAAPAPASTPAAAHPLLATVAGGLPDEPWGGLLAPDRAAFLLDHQVSGRSLMPGAGFMEFMHAASRQLFGSTPAEIRDVRFGELLLLTSDELGQIEMRVSASQEGAAWHVDVASRPAPNAAWTQHAQARLVPGTPAAEETQLSAIQRRCQTRQASDEFYRQHEGSGNGWHGSFRGISEFWHGSGETLARIRAVPDGGFVFHPAAMDACLQAAIAVLPGTDDATPSSFVLLGADRIRLLADSVSGRLWSHARLAAGRGEVLRTDITVFNETGRVIAEIDGVQAQRLGQGGPSAADANPSAEGPHQIIWRDVTPTGQPTLSGGGHWLVLCGGSALDEPLLAGMRSAGCTVSAVHNGTSYAEDGSTYTIGSGSETDLARALKSAAHTAPLSGIVNLWALASTTGQDAPADEVERTATELCTGLTALGRGVDDLHAPDPLPLFVVTRGAQSALRGEPCPAPWQATLWGYGPVLGLEQRSATVTLIDLSASDDPSHNGAHEPSDLVTALLSPGREDRFALRGGRRYAPRLVPGRPTPLPQTGSIARGQVEIRVSHAGVGSDECAGEITRTGQEVTGLSVGDKVLAFAPGGAGLSTVVVSAQLVVRKPERLSMAEAGSVPIDYGAAYHALIDLGRLRPGERVLIHSAASATGVAALAVARWRGARIYATADGAASREMLTALGAEKVAGTQADLPVEFGASGEPGTGVNVVLNTQAGNAAAGFELLEPFGRYVDLTTIDATPDRVLPVAAFSEGRSYLHADITELYQRSPAMAGEVLRVLAGLFEAGELAPPTFRVLPVDRSDEAAVLANQPGHLGKITLAFSDRHSAPNTPPRIRPDATYLVTGGLSGVGGLCAEWLVSEGAKHILLTGRSRITADPASSDRRAILLARLLAGPAEIQYEAVDIANEQAMADVLRARADAGLPPVAGLFHSATILEPGGIRGLTGEDIDRALAPKVAGGWVLHRLFSDQSLDFFILFSSAVAILGGLSLSHQLGVYTAGNTFTDALIDQRISLGLPATVVNWGFWVETGLAVRLSEESGHDVRPEGLLTIHPSEAPGLFREALLTKGRMIFLPADWHAYTNAYPADAERPMLRELISDETPPAAAPAYAAPAAAPPAAAAPAPAVAASPAPVIAEPERPATPPASAPQPAPTAEPSAVSATELEEQLVNYLAQVLGQPPARINRTRPMNRLGLDSLMATELRTWLRREHGHETTVPQLLSPASIRDLATTLTNDAKNAAPAATPTPAPPATPPAAPASNPPTEPAPAPEPPAATTPPAPVAESAAQPAPSTAATPTAPAAPAPEAAPSTSTATELEEQLVAYLAQVLGQPPARINRTRPMNRLGLDSLMATELRTWLRREHGHETTVPQLLSPASIRDLATTLTNDAKDAS